MGAVGRPHGATPSGEARGRVSLAVEPVDVVVLAVGGRSPAPDACPTWGAHDGAHPRGRTRR